MVAVYAIEFAAYGAPEGYGVMLAPLVAVYTVGRYLETRRAVLGLALGAMLWFAWMYFDPMNTSWPERAGTVVWLGPWIIGWLVGVVVRVVQLYREERRVAAAQLASRVVADERNRISRELHDVIGHSLSVMTVQTSAVRRRLAPEQTDEREALESVESVGREALAEMRRMVGVLRQADDTLGQPQEPAPSLAQVGSLAETVRAAGLPVTVAVSGRVRALPPGADLTAYRVVQEGLTNALRHGRGSHSAQVDIVYGDHALALAVRNDGAPSVGDGGRTGTAPEGSGLVGMRERVAAYGGSMVARHRAEGGFELLVRLPLEAA
jgi:signal transduction histidine kinase